jgi:hypothetical protein
MSDVKNIVLVLEQQRCNADSSGKTGLHTAYEYHILKQAFL